MWQTYLFVKILVYCPVRQEEIRNYRLGETLFRREDEEGNPYYEAYFKKHKRAATSPVRNYRLPAILTEDLDMWVYRWYPLIKESIQTLEGWIEFWGHTPEKIEGLRQRIAAGREGLICKRARLSPDKYIQEQERTLRGIERRIAGWETAKNNFESYNHLFFMFGKRGIEAFGRPFTRDNFWEVFRRAIANATQALFGEARWTNPHALRHIAEKHIRQPGKVNITEPFGTLIGHSKEMGDEYAEQITSEYDLTEEITDIWWIEDI
jgi:integrase